MFPGLSINIGKKSISASVGVPGLRVTKGLLGSNKTTKSVGLVGTGIGFTEQTSAPRVMADLPAEPQQATAGGVVLRFLVGCGVLFVVYLVFKGH